MKTKSAQPPMNSTSADDFQTPAEAIHPLIEFLDKNWKIWECACGNGNLVSRLESFGFEVIGTDVITGHNFLNWKPEEFDCVITNPPYSIKQMFLERCYNLKKPFALLMPLTGFESQERQRLYKKHGLEVVFMDKRLNFETPSGNGSGSWFMTAWFTWGLNLPQQINFTKLDGSAHPNQSKLAFANVEGMRNTEVK